MLDDEEPVREPARLYPLLPVNIYTNKQLDPYPAAEVRAYKLARQEYLRAQGMNPRSEARIQVPEAVPEPAPAPAAAPAPAVAPAAAPAGGRDIAMNDNSGGGAVVARRRNAAYMTGGQRSSFSGDRKIILQGYKENSLCNTLVFDALQRIQAALQILDPVHASIIQARVARAGLKNGNASHQDITEITFKKAVSIALQAERWVYEAQAAAAKSMVKESHRCLHNLAGRRKRTVEEKEAAYQKRYGLPRGTRNDRAIRKKQKQIENLKAE